MLNISRLGNKTFSIIAMTVILIFSPLVSVAGTAYESNRGVDLDTGYSAASQVHVTTRRQAIIDYVMALYSEDDSSFYGWLGDTPTDPRIGSYPDIYDVSDPYFILKRLDATGVLDWNKSREFLKSLVNVNPQSPYYGLVNFSQGGSGPGVTTSKEAIQIFPELGLDDWLYTDQIALLTSGRQVAGGGFTLYYDDDEFIPPDMITTRAALTALSALDRLDLVDTAAALDFVMSTYSDNGGFSNVPGGEAIPGVVPLGIFSLQILGRTDLIRTENTTAFLLQYWDNSTGSMYGGTVTETERMVWSLYELGTLDRIDINKTLSWVIASQTIQNGAFLSVPSETVDNERLEWTRAATHTLELTDRMDLLDENITIIEYPKYTIPQWYIDYTNENFGTTTSNLPGPFIMPNVDVVGFLVSIAPGLTVVFILALPGVYLVWSERMRRAERRQLRKRRKKHKS